MNTLIKVLCLAGLFTAAVFAGPAPSLPTWKGTYDGSCVQLASTNAAGTKATCVQAGSVFAFPYYATWSKQLRPYLSLKFQWSQDATVTTSFANKNVTYSVPSVVSSTALVNVTNAGKASCVTAYFKEGKATFRARIERVGKTNVYIEEGVIYTGNNSAVSYGCEKADNPKLYCNQDTFNYRCVAYDV